VSVQDVDRVPAILADIERFAVTARRGVRATRNFVAHDYDGTDEEILWQAVAVQFPRIVNALIG